MLNNKWRLAAIGAVSLLCTNLSYAERSGFYTIIGPDGRMIVIDRTASDGGRVKAKAKPSTQKNSQIQLKQPVLTQPAIKQTAVDKAAVEEKSIPQVQLNLPQNNQNTPANVAVETAASKTTNASKVSASKPYDAKLPDTKQVASSKSLTESKTLPQANKNNSSIVDRSSQKAVIDSQSSIALSSNPVPTTPSDQSAQTNQSSENPVTIIDGEQYIDSEYLEQREFNLEGKKRFYNLPNGIGGTEVLEREKGVDMSVFKRNKAEQPQVVNLAKGYQRIDKDQVVELIGMQCFSQKQLKKPKLFRRNDPLNLWPRPGFEPKFDFVVAEFEQQINDIQLISYTDNMAEPQFYWPLPIFLDSKGCVIEGVNGFYQQAIPSTVVTQQAIQGYLHIPLGTKYLVLTPLEAAVDLTQVKLTNKGQIRLTPIR